jgi:hypothetical protein
VAEIGAPGDAPAVNTTFDGVKVPLVGGRQRESIALVGASQDVQEEGGVADGAGHRAGVGGELVGAG